MFSVYRRTVVALSPGDGMLYLGETEDGGYSAEINLRTGDFELPTGTLTPEFWEAVAYLGRQVLLKTEMMAGIHDAISMLEDQSDPHNVIEHLAALLAEDRDYE